MNSFEIFDYLHLLFLGCMLALFGLSAFLWSLRDGQYDDLDGSVYRPFLDDKDEPL